MTPNGIEDVIAVLNEMVELKLVDSFAIGGAFAATLHNEPIATVDLDIFFILKEKQNRVILSLDGVYEFVGKKGFEFDHEFVNIYGWLVQFVESSHNPLWRSAIETAQKLNLAGRVIPVIDPEHLVAMWLFAGRSKDYQKIAMFLEANIVDHGRLKNLLVEHGLMLKWEKERVRFDETGN